MSRKAFVATQDGTFTPGSGAVNDKPFLTFPFKYEDGAPIGTDYPLAVDFEAANYFWFRPDQIEVAVAWVDGAGGGTNFTRSFPLLRKEFYLDTNNITEETHLFLPGLDAVDSTGTPAEIADYYVGTFSEPDWNGSPGAVLNIGATARLFFRDALGADERLYVDGPDFYPSIYVQGSFTVSTPGTEAVQSWSSRASAELTPPLDPAGCNFFAGVGGAAIGTVEFTGTFTGGGASLNLTYAPFHWFAWPNIYGNTPKYNVLTGAALF